MKNFAASLVRAIAILLCAIVIGTAALTVVYMIPAEKYKKNVEKSLKQIEPEGDYYSPFGLIGDIFDNYTDLMLLDMLITSGNEGPLDDALSGYRYYSGTAEDWKNDVHIDTFKDTSEGLYGVGNKGVNEIRFWNGYMVPLKIIFLFTDYGSVRQLNMVLELLLVAVIVLLMVKRRLGAYAIPFVLTYISMNPFTIACNMIFSCVLYSALIPMLIMLLRHDQIKRYGLFFFGIGVATAYFNMFEFQIITLGLPLMLYYLLNGWPKDVKSAVIDGVKLCVAWGIGYAAMWGAKWLLAALLTNHDVWSLVKGQVQVRTQDYGFGFRIKTVLLNAYVNVRNFGWFLLEMAFAVVCLGKSKNTKGKDALTCLAIMLIPIAWYMVMSNHSFVHYWCVYRSMAVSTFALLCLFARGVEISEKQKPEKREKAPIKGLIFDVDGTLYRQTPVRLNIGMQMLREMTNKVHRPYLLGVLRYRKARNAHADWSNDKCKIYAARENLDEQLLSAYIERWMEDEPLKYIEKYQRKAVVEKIKKLQACGVKTVAYSDYPTEKKTHALGIFADIEIYPGRGTDTAKPSAKSMQAVLTATGEAPESLLYVGDTEKDSVSAEIAGIWYTDCREFGKEEKKSEKILENHAT